MIWKMLRTADVALIIEKVKLVKSASSPDATWCVGACPAHLRKLRCTRLQVSQHICTLTCAPATVNMRLTTAQSPLDD